MASPEVHSTGLALKKLRTCVVSCCFIVGIAVFAQIFVWSLATYTDLRYTVPEQPAKAAFVVPPEEVRRHLIRSAQDREGTDEEFDLTDFRAPGINQVGVLTNFDRFLQDVSSLGSAAGTLALLVLLPLLLMGFTLVSTSEKVGVDKTISAFVWSIVVAVLALPMGGVLEVPWQDGIFRPYAAMIREVEGVREDYGGAGAGFLFYSRYLVIPAACIAATCLIGWRFQSGVEAGLPPESQRIDEELEAEATIVAKSATSLHGGAGRSSGALKRAVTGSTEVPDPLRPFRPMQALDSIEEPAKKKKKDKKKKKKKKDEELPHPASVTQLSPGEMPKRLI